jgi:hypothetical protein
MNDHETTLTLYAPKDKRAADWWNSLGGERRREVLCWLSCNPAPRGWLDNWTSIDWAFEEMPQLEFLRQLGL